MPFANWRNYLNTGLLCTGLNYRPAVDADLNTPETIALDSNNIYIYRMQEKIASVKLIEMV